MNRRPAIYIKLMRLYGWTIVATTLLLCVITAQYAPPDCYVSPTLIVCDTLL